MRPELPQHQIVRHAARLRELDGDPAREQPLDRTAAYIDRPSVYVETRAGS